MHATHLFLALLLASSGDPDADRDGLSDFQELHKYFTDPRKADSDGDGIPDGDWDERREFTYSVRAVMHVMAPFDVGSMNDDYQDVRVLERRPDLLEFEVVVYPFNTVASAITPDSTWRKLPSELRPWVAPGVCCNWDKDLQTELLAALARDGIEPASCTDAELARRASRWMMDHAEFEDSFTTFAVEFPDRVPRVDPLQEDVVARALEERGRTLAEQWDHELLGKGMFRTRTHGSCTSSAIYLSTGLKALGLPTRSIVCVPIVDANDEREVAWIRERITHSRVRRALIRATDDMKGAWASHTFNEVWVGGRWQRLNYTNLGQNVLDPGTLGLMVHVHTFNDHSEAGLAAWGRRRAHPLHAALFGGPNPYSCVSLSDRFGVHATIGDEPGLTELRVERLYWYDDPEKSERVQMRLDDPETAGHLLVHVGGDSAVADDYADFYARVGKAFLLRARGEADVPVRATRGYWVDPSRDVREFYLRIEPGDLARMRPGVRYRLEWVPEDGPCRWTLERGLEIELSRR